MLIRNGCEVFIHINNDFREDWPSLCVSWDLNMRSEIFPMSVLSRLILQILICPLPQKAMENLVTHITTKYAGKKLGVFCSNDDIAGLFERQCIKKGISIPEQLS